MNTKELKGTHKNSPISKFLLVNVFSVISTIFVISFATPCFMIVIIPLTIMYFLVQVRIMYL